jgi:hypothetical protein
MRPFEAPSCGTPGRPSMPRAMGGGRGCAEAGEARRRRARGHGHVRCGVCGGTGGETRAENSWLAALGVGGQNVYTGENRPSIDESNVWARLNFSNEHPNTRDHCRAREVTIDANRAPTETRTEIGAPVRRVQTQTRTTERTRRPERGGNTRERGGYLAS